MDVTLLDALPPATQSNLNDVLQGSPLHILTEPGDFSSWKTDLEAVQNLLVAVHRLTPYCHACNARSTDGRQPGFHREVIQACVSAQMCRLMPYTVNERVLVYMRVLGFSGTGTTDQGIFRDYAGRATEAIFDKGRLTTHPGERRAMIRLATHMRPHEFPVEFPFGNSLAWLVVESTNAGHKHCTGPPHSQYLANCCVQDSIDPVISTQDIDVLRDGLDFLETLGYAEIRGSKLKLICGSLDRIKLKRQQETTASNAAHNSKVSSNFGFALQHSAQRSAPNASNLEANDRELGHKTEYTSSAQSRYLTRDHGRATDGTAIQNTQSRMYEGSNFDAPILLEGEAYPHVHRDRLQNVSAVGFAANNPIQQLDHDFPDTREDDVEPRNHASKAVAGAADCSPQIIKSEYGGQKKKRKSNRHAQQQEEDRREKKKKKHKS